MFGRGLQSGEKRVVFFRCAHCDTQTIVTMQLVASEATHHCVFVCHGFVQRLGFVPHSKQQKVRVTVEHLCHQRRHLSQLVGQTLSLSQQPLNVRLNRLHSERVGEYVLGEMCRELVDVVRGLDVVHQLDDVR